MASSPFGSIFGSHSPKIALCGPSDNDGCKTARCTYWAQRAVSRVNENGFLRW